MSSSTQTQALDVPSAIVQRRSIKTFKPDSISPDLLKQLVELTVAAPSSFNVQSWRIVLVQEETQKQALCAASWNQKQIIQAPVTFVFAADTAAGEKDLTPILEQGLATGAWNEGTVNYFRNAIPQFQAGLGDKRREYAIKDAMIAATNLVLAAESLGLSTCFMNGWIEEQVKAIIGAENNPDIAIAVLVPVGYAAEPRLNPGRLPLSVNVSVDKLDNPYEG
ncbi:nitroreductase family protein [Anabaena sp. FACHB-1250]|uniref:Nitroreductase domain-containing protein n=2 Tax=Dolichospermum TaxID=748770 RepID=A0A480AAK1_9CYAN|nr:MULTISPECIES: nitroreductase family protein [Dolichospermum]MBD2140098.1 nitroreductase family protein [Anabaena sp. FACHB-1250]MBD2267514.1 nitroreductase family protein [Anabaena sp. FACHB-1391]MDB9482495.1 nitroreductase family protein [Dolichospermum circinale CS-537/05]MBE9219220.1 nitroreductase family protein [Dolichospermum flos-aquae LEGE 04289]MDB9474592.1 nitroreductase family protein [Dolichospermum circinale CS-537/11]